MLEIEDINRLPGNNSSALFYYPAREAGLGWWLSVNERYVEKKAIANKTVLVNHQHFKR